MKAAAWHVELYISIVLLGMKIGRKKLKRRSDVRIVNKSKRTETLRER